MIDSQYQIETAEGIDIYIEPAGLAVRSYAFAIDALLRILIVMGAGFAIEAFAEFGIGILLLIIFIVEWFYPIIFEVTRGATPGKSAMGLRVVYDNGLPIGFAGSVTRNLLRFVDLLPFCYVTGAVSIILSDANKRLGDIVAGTCVIYKGKQKHASEFSFERDTGSLIAMSTEQQQLVIAFAERAKNLSQARQEELAAYLVEVLGIEKEQAVQRLKSMAAVLVGKV